MSKKKILLACDWNGTLLDDVEAWFRGAVAAMEVFGVLIGLDDIRDAFATPIVKTYINLGITEADLRSKGRESQDAFHTIYRENADSITLREGARDMLCQLSTEGHVELIIVSNHIQDSLVGEAESLGVSKNFTHISGRSTQGELVDKTTKLDRLQAFMEAHGYAGGNTVILGDTPEEADMARSIGGRSICIAGGCASEKRIIEAQPDHIINSLLEVPDILRALR